MEKLKGVEQTCGHFEKVNRITRGYGENINYLCSYFGYLRDKKPEKF